MNEIYRGRRDALIDGLGRIGWEIEKPKGTMFVWAPIPEPYEELGSLEFAKLLVQEAKVAVSPGVGFGPGGEGFVRFALVENEQRIDQAVRGIRTRPHQARLTRLSLRTGVSGPSHTTVADAGCGRVRRRSTQSRARSTPRCHSARRRSRSGERVGRERGVLAARRAAASLGRRPHAFGEPGEERGAERGGLVDDRSPHRDAEHVGLELAQQVHHARAAVDPQLRDRRCRRAARDRVDDVGGLLRHRLDRGARDVRARRAAGEAERSCRARTGPSTASRAR